MSLALRYKFPGGTRKPQYWISSFSQFVSLSFHRVHGTAFSYGALTVHKRFTARVFVCLRGEITSAVLSPLISGVESRCSLAIKIHTRSERLLSYLGEAAPRWQAGSLLGAEGRAGERERYMLMRWLRWSKEMHHGLPLMGSPMPSSPLRATVDTGRSGAVIRGRKWGEWGKEGGRAEKDRRRREGRHAWKGDRWQWTSETWQDKERNLRITFPLALNR